MSAREEESSRPVRCPECQGYECDPNCPGEDVDLTDARCAECGERLEAGEVYRCFWCESGRAA